MLFDSRIHREMADRAATLFCQNFQDGGSVSRAQFDPPYKNQSSMKRFQSIMRDTWWVWLVLCGGGTIAGSFVSFIFFSAIPISFFAFFYFALMRYDDDGNHRGG